MTRAASGCCPAAALSERYPSAPGRAAHRSEQLADCRLALHSAVEGDEYHDAVRCAVCPRFGQHVCATGGNRNAARTSGIDVNRVKIICFMLTSGLCGLNASLIWGYLHVAVPIAGAGLEFRVIGAVIIRGVALTGGRGTIYGTLLGAIIIGIITNEIVLLGFSQYFGDVATGFLIMLVGALDLIVQRGAARACNISNVEP